MTLFLHIIIFLGSCLLLAISGKWLIEAISRIGIFFKIKEFILAFFVVALGTTLPNFVIGVISAIKGIPELSFGDVIGANIFDMTIVIGLAALISRGGLIAQSRTVQGSAIYTLIVAILPVLLIFDGKLSRPDGLILLLSFAIYAGWLFSKKERFSKVYENCEKSYEIKLFLKDLFLVTIGLVMLLGGGYGIVESANYFNQEMNLQLGLIGLFVVAIGTCLPELFFSLHAARCGQDWMIFGNQMGNIAFTSTFILGTVSLIKPIEIVNFQPFAIARIFLIIGAVLFFLFLKTSQKITKKEGLFLIGVYIAFLIVEILTK